MVTKKSISLDQPRNFTEVKKSSNKKFISYEEEYERIKPLVDREDFETMSSFLKLLEKKISKNKFSKKHNLAILEILKLVLYSKFSKISLGFALLEKIERTVNFIDSKDSLMYIDYMIAKSDLYWKIGRLNDALILLDDIEKRFSEKKLSNKVLERIGDLFTLKGIIFWLKGDVNESQNSFQSSLAVMGRVGNKLKFTDALNNLGNVSIYKGDLNVALDLHSQALEIRMTIGIKNKIASSLGNIAEIYHYKGDYDKSLENYLQAKELFDEIKNVLFQVKLNYQLLTLYLEYNKLDLAKVTLISLDELQKSTPENEYIQMLYSFSEGLLLKKSDRLLDKFHAAIKFNSIIHNKVIDNEITVQLILNLTDILLLEIRLSNNEQILEDIRNYCSQVHQIAELQNSAGLLVQGFLLESKLDLLDFKYSKAKNILMNGVTISKEKNISKFEYLASKELDKLLQTEEKWMELKERHAPLSERLDLTGIEETLFSLTRRREETIEIEREEPILFIILQIGGLSAFSSKFKDGMNIDDQLIGGFISAVNTFGQQIFSSTGKVERIKHGEFTLISKIVLENFIFCYAFKGPSYLASKKFDLLIDKFLQHPIKETFIRNLRTGYLLDQNEEQLMNDLVEDAIFISEKEETHLLNIAS